MQPHGTLYEEAGDMMSRIIDRGSCVQAELRWRDGALIELAVPGAVVRGDVVTDELLGPAHPIVGAPPASPALTVMSAIEWARPIQIPAIAAPGRLPPGAGGAILNTIAALASRAGVPALRYAGPYPTPALFRVLARSFRTTATETAFTASLIDRAARVARDPMPFEFVPAPHERIAIPHGYVELREGLERAVIDRIAYDRDGSPARLHDHRAEIWFGDAPWAHVATFAADGALLAGPHPIPACTSDVIGKPFPAPLRVALADLVADLVPAPLATDARAIVAARSLQWADLGARAAARDATGFTLHAALWDRIAPLGLPRLALALAEALAPVVTLAILAC